MPFPERRSLLSLKLLPALLVAILATLPASPGLAVALGEANVRSSLGQKLDAVIDITSISAAEAESLAVRLAPAAMFAEAGLDYGALQRALRLSIEKKNDRTLIRVSSELPVSDPFLILLIEVNAAGNRTVRQYALLLDPPATDQDKRSAAIEPPAISAPSAASANSATSAASAQPSASAADQLPETTTTTDTTKTTEPTEPVGRSGPTSSSPTRLVRRGDTLAKFARDAMPPGATLEQALVAFLQANPAAFDGKNIHRMKSGTVLSVPDDQAIADVPAAEARREVALQTADYQRYRNALARTAARSAEKSAEAGAPSAVTGNRSSSGTVGVKEPSPEPSADARDQLTLESAQDKRVSAAQRDERHRELAQIASDKALSEANSRIAELEKNIGDMQQQLAVRNQTLADTQQRAEQAAAESASKPASATDKPSDAGVSEARPAKTEQAPSAAKDQDIGDYFAKLQRALANDPLPVAGSLGILSAGLLMLWLRSRLRKRRLPVSRTEPHSEGQSVFGQAGGQNVDTSNSVFHSNFVPSVSQLDANEVDAIAEADVYIAYGRDEQAEEILLDALKHHPQRHALRVKLLEIYLARKDVQKFGAVAAELRVLTHGQGSEWGQAAQMGQQLDPGNLLYGGAPAAATVMATGMATDKAPSLAPVVKAAPTAVADQASAAAPAVTSSGNAAARAAERSSLSSVHPPLGLVRPDDSMTSSSAVEDFGIKLEGLLDERRKDAGTGLSLTPINTAPAPEAVPAADFQLSGIAPGAAAAVTGADAGADALALKTKIDLALACQEIGDSDAARELLAEVAGTRHPEFASRARSLLQQLA